ncbi:MAG: hypothetical protein NWQ53_01150 [Flavobacteriales bacterium]|nr:hypothetical protein [Flavobacteriales bacterium]
MMKVLTWVLMYAWQLIVSVPAKQEASLDMDALGHSYVWTPEKITMYDTKGRELFFYSELAFGDIQSIDVRDALKPLVFYQDAGKLVFLDNTLSPQSNVIDLFEVYDGMAVAICSSIDNNYWVFDAQRQEIVRVDAAFNEITSSGSLSALGIDGFYPEQLFESNQQLYVWEENYGFLVFDLFGTLIRRIPILDVQHVHLRKGQLLLTKTSGEVLKYNWLDYQFEAVPLPALPAAPRAVVKNAEVYGFLVNKELFLYR